MLTIPCAECHRILRLGPENLGQTVQCPVCGRVQVAGEPGHGSDQIVAGRPPVATAENVPEDGIATVLPAQGPQSYAASLTFPVECPYCAEMMPLSADQCPACQRPVDDTTLETEIRSLQDQRRLLNIFSYLCGLPGIILLFLVEVQICMPEPGGQADFSAILCLGLLLLGVGVGLAAKYKGHSPLYGALVFLCLVGFFLLPFLVPDDDGKKLKRLKRTIEQRARPPGAGASMGWLLRP